MHPGAPRPRDAAGPWAQSLAWGFVVWIVLTFVVMAVDGDNFSWSLGRAFVMAAVPTLVVGLIARESTSPRRWWYPVYVGAGGAALCAALTVTQEVRDRLDPDAVLEDRAEQTQVEPGARRLTAPSRAGDWSLARGPAARARTQATLERVDAAPPDFKDALVDVAAGEYRRSDGARLAYYGLTVGQSDLADEMEESPADAADDVLAGVGAVERRAFDAGDLGGALVCGVVEPAVPGIWATCAWADGATVGVVTLGGQDEGAEEAAALIRAFRADVTSVE